MPELDVRCQVEDLVLPLTRTELGDLLLHCQEHQITPEEAVRNALLEQIPR